MKASPVTRMGWHKHYVDLFNKTNGKRGERLANWFLLLHLAFDEQSSEEPRAVAYQTRKQKAQAFWEVICNTQDGVLRAETADKLQQLKKGSKVSWKTLGIPNMS